MTEINQLVADTRNIIVCSVDEKGYPNAKAMFKTVHDDLKSFYFSTNTSSMRTQQFMKNSQASLYFCGNEEINGLMLIGEMKVLTDSAIKQQFWQEGWKIFYPKGVNDPDYCILQFTAKQGHYYHALQKHNFDIE
ncbi:MAG TPA: pyridoxamine 5'-phosphate oxidase [Firmicutes bacterium]|nr:pyridoxamine 5'-phosphate oxidase [Bacillota bacterium]